MINSVFSTIRKQLLCTMTLGLGAIMLSIPSVAEANPAAAAAKAIFKGGKVVSKAKPIKVPTVKVPPQAPGAATHTEGIDPRAIIYWERRRREQEKREAQNRGWFN